MKSTALTMILMSFAVTAFAQHEHASAPSPAPPSEGRRSFEALKTIAGSWEGTLTTVPPIEELAGKRVRVVVRETSRGNALMHEMTLSGTPDDPITMLYVDNDRLTMTHYCDAGNRPRMAGRLAADGKTIAFEVLDVSGSTQYGHMADAVFTIVDANHHFEEWKFKGPDGKHMIGRFDLQRTKEPSGPFGQ